MSAIIVLFFILLVPMCRQRVFDYCNQAGNTMVPTMANKQIFYVNKLAYLANPPQRWDVVVSHIPISKKVCALRVVGLPGDKIEAINNALYINGKKIKYPNNLKYLHYTADFVVPKDVDFTLPKIRYPYTVPKNSYYLRGDNNKTAYDSRGFGAVPIKDIVGKVILRD